MFRRDFFHSLAMASLMGVLPGADVWGKEPDLNILYPTYSGETETLEPIATNAKLDIAAKAIDNQNTFMEQFLTDIYMGDIIFAPTSTLSRLANRGFLRKFNMQKIPNYTRPEATLVGRKTQMENDYILPLGYYYSMIGVIKQKFKGRWNLNWSELIGNKELKAKVGFAYHDFNDIIRLVSLTIGLGYALKPIYRERIKDFLYKYRENWFFAGDMQNELREKRVDATIIHSNELFNLIKLFPNDFFGVLPDEGIIVNELSVAIARNAKNPDFAEKMINLLYQPLVQKVILEYSHLATQNKNYAKIMGKSYTENQFLYPVLDKKIIFHENLYEGEEIYSFAEKIYKEVLA